MPWLSDGSARTIETSPWDRFALGPWKGSILLTSLQIKNFKAWRDTGQIELAPLTILFGANSSGKSSLHQFLLMLRQTVESPDRKRVLHTGDENTPVDLGSYSELVTDGDATVPLEFELAWRRPDPLRITDPRTKMRFEGRDLSFSSKFSATGESPPRVSVDEYSYTLRTKGESGPLGLRSWRESPGVYRIDAIGVELIRTLGRKWPVSAPSQFHAFPDDLATRYQHLDFAPDLTLALKEQLSALNYLGPLREKPGRLYRWSGEEVEHVGWRGERTVEALLAGRDRQFNTHPRKRYQPLQGVVARWLTTLGVIDSFTVTPIGHGRDEYEVRVKTPGSPREVLLTDVGFGVSQVLPVIVECFYSAPGSTLIMEQPEIHLHPSVQAGLADLFIEAITMREHGKPRDVQLIIESHSEHLLRRLLRRIAEEKVERNQVRCYVVNAGPAGSTIEPLEVDDFGNVHNWPDNFFGDPAKDLIAQSRSARERRRQERTEA